MPLVSDLTQLYTIWHPEGGFSVNWNNVPIGTPNGGLPPLFLTFGEADAHRWRYYYGGGCHVIGYALKRNYG